MPMNTYRRAIYLGVGITIFFAANLNAPAADGEPQWTVTWEQIYAEEMPPVELFEGCMAYDEKRDRVVLVGGGDFGEVWEWDGQVWTSHEVSTTSGPSLCIGDSLVYDPIRESIIAIGPAPEDPTDDEIPLYLDLWEWTGDEWVHLSTNLDLDAPLSRFGHATAFDEARDEMLLHGGLLWSTALYDVEEHLAEDCAANISWLTVPLYDTWVFSENNDWQDQDPTCRTPTGTRIDEFAPLMSYDTQRELVFMVRLLKEDYPWDVWTWNGNKWSETQAPSEALSDFFPLGIFYQANVETTLIFGFFENELDDPKLELLYWNGETWRVLHSYDDTRTSNFWERLLGTDQSEFVLGSIPSHAYDSKEDQLILFGADDEGEAAMWSLRIENVSDSLAHEGTLGCGCSSC